MHIGKEHFLDNLDKHFGAEDCAKDGSEELFTKMRCISVKSFSPLSLTQSSTNRFLSNVCKMVNKVLSPLFHSYPVIRNCTRGSGERPVSPWHA